MKNLILYFKERNGQFVINLGADVILGGQAVEPEVGKDALDLAGHVVRMLYREERSRRGNKLKESGFWIPNIMNRTR